MWSDSSSVNRLSGSSQHFSTYKSKEYAGHRKQVRSVSWNLNGTKLASGSVDTTARVWQIESAAAPPAPPAPALGNKQATGMTSTGGTGGTGGAATIEMELKGHTDCVEQIAWSPIHADYLASTSADKSVRIWDTRNGKCSYVVGTQGENINIAWSTDGKYLAVGNKKNQISIMDTRKFTIVKNIHFQHEINEICWSRGSDYFLLTTGKGTLDLCKFNGGNVDLKNMISIPAHMGSLFCVKFDPKWRYLATGGADALVALWDPSTFTCVRTCNRLESPIRTLSFSHDGMYLASASEDPRIDIAEVESGQRVTSVEVHAEMNSLAWSPRELLLAYATDDAHAKYVGTVYVYRPDTI